MNNLASIDYAGPALLVVFGIIGAACLPNTIDRHGTGAALMLFGCYLLLTWIAIHSH